MEARPLPPNQEHFVRTVDLSRLLPLKMIPKMVPGGPAQIPYVEAAKLRAFLRGEFSKKPNDRATVKFIDCQNAAGTSQQRTSILGPQLTPLVTAFGSNLSLASR